MLSWPFVRADSKNKSLIDFHLGKNLSLAIRLLCKKDSADMQFFGFRFFFRQHIFILIDKRDINL